jgi:hypothetical protein
VIICLSSHTTQLSSGGSGSINYETIKYIDTHITGYVTATITHTHFIKVGSSTFLSGITVMSAVLFLHGF